MERYFKATPTPTPTTHEESSSNVHIQSDPHELPNFYIETNFPELPSDPSLRLYITLYDSNIRERVRRAYLLKGPCQPRNLEFQQTLIGGQLRRFSSSWYSGNENWLEYSENKDAVFCLCCYLFKPEIGHQGGEDSFVTEGYSNWKKKEKLAQHVGKCNSIHNQAWEKCQALLDQKQQVEPLLLRKVNENSNDYRIRLNASIDCIRFLLKQELAFRGHDESESSSNQGNFLNLLRFLAEQNESARVVILRNAPENLKLTAPSIQKDIVNAFSIETINAIIRELGDGLFALLVDESRDISCKEQMAVVLKYIDSRAYVNERVIGINHVKSTTARSLKESIDELFATHGLSIDRLMFMFHMGGQSVGLNK